MDVPRDWTELVEPCTDVHELAKAAGALCLDSKGHIAAVRHASPSSHQIVRRVEERVIELSPALDDGPPTALATDAALLEDVHLLEPAWPMAALGLVRGLCRSVLTRYYASTFDVVDLSYGQPFPLPSRPTHKALPDATPHLEVADEGHLLERTGFRLCKVASSDHVQLRLDFSRRIDLDEVTWDHGSSRFPLIATIHPYAEATALMPPAVIGDDWWFGVHPVADAWLASDLPALLAAARGRASIAVAPELCLPAAQVLGDLLSEAPDSFPPLVVPGSAHEPTMPVGTAAEDAPAHRTNSAIAYLRGVPLLRHDKIHPFSSRDVGQGEPWDEARPEGLSGETRTITVAAGAVTRFAVVICADLNDMDVLGLLSHLGTNLLVVPALTPHEGAFSAVPAALASHCQGLTVIVNGTPPGGGSPFMVMVGVPRRKPAEQLTSFPEPPGGRRAVGILDPNVPLTAALTWLPMPDPA